ncbi:replicative DNA helicase [Endozoicomonas sp. OPT23]|uniref:replicative DNA helicase n=1 Tax=Endozoicomonas sp. OPT23 TaxID=2072845 RepID=UPI00129B3D98|nr:replicative DNA helicase [Endozoicomonas sp. OPT23]MRI31703.1 replicative DNA helicase [Endozoicomonas sp. OPT23]
MLEALPRDSVQLPIDEATVSLKTPPHSIEAEQSVIGGLLLDNEAWDKVADKIVAEDFYHPRHKVIFKAMAQSANESLPFDPLTLAAALDNLSELEEAGGMGYITEVVANVAGIANIEAYAAIIQEKSVFRKLINISSQISEKAYQPEGLNSQAILDEAERLVFNIAEERPKTGGPVGVREILDNTVQKIDELFNTKGSLTGVTTGFKDLDEMTSGMNPSDMIIVAARPSMGKTTFAMNLVENALLNSDKVVMVFSLEMPSEQLMMRMLSSLGRINQSKVRSGQLEEEDWPKLVSAVERIKDKKLFIDDTSGISPSEMRSRIRRVVREHGDMAMIMIDYLQLMQIPGFSEGRTNEISEISRSLKAIAKEFNVPVVALSQLNRSLEQRPNKRPVNSDLRESGAIEQDADVIMFIYRDEVYNPDTEYKGVGEIIIGKQRNGPIGSCRLAFIGQYTRFENLAPDAFANFDDE